MKGFVKRGGKIEKILFALVAGAFVTAQLLDLMLMGGRSKSYKRMRGRLYGESYFSEPPEPAFSDKQQFYSLLNHLKRQGLVEKRVSKKGILWHITSAGLKKLKLIRDKKTDYEPVKDNKLRIIVFDVPEKERGKRLWLCEALRVLGFRILQRSVWIGKNQIPEKFLQDLHQKSMLSYIHILEISKFGTVKELF